MFKLKQTDYDVNPDVAPISTVLEGEYPTKEAAEEAALAIACSIRDALNKEGAECGNYFEVGDYEEFFVEDDDKYVCYPVSVIWYDHAPDDRENDCCIRPVIGWEII